MNNKIVYLRNHLFAAIEALQDTTNPMAIDRAKAIAEVGAVIVNSAKVEVEFLKVTGGKGAGTGFIQNDNAPALPAPDTAKGKVTVVRQQSKVY